jgi:hypothetical protein
MKYEWWYQDQKTLKIMLNPILNIDANEKGKNLKPEMRTNLAVLLSSFLKKTCSPSREKTIVL